MTKMVPVAQAGGDKIQYMQPVACGGNAKGTCKTATTKSDSFDEKTENLSPPL